VGGLEVSDVKFAAGGRADSGVAGGGNIEWAQIGREFAGTLRVDKMKKGATFEAAEFGVFQMIAGWGKVGERGRRQTVMLREIGDSGGVGEPAAVTMVDYLFDVIAGGVGAELWSRGLQECSVARKACEQDDGQAGGDGEAAPENGSAAGGDLLANALIENGGLDGFG